MMQMLELAGFPAHSETFAELERQAIEKLKERERENYLAFLQSDAYFKRFKKEYHGDWPAEPTATVVTIARKNGGGES
jgi:hypothetical protein